jgi:hypothetical protein
MKDMIAQISLTPAESKKLIAKAIVQMDIVRRAAKEGMIVLHPSSSTYFIVEELTGSKPKTNVWVCGVVAPRGTCIEMGTMTGEQSSIASGGGPADFRHSWVLRDGKLSAGDKLSELLEQMGPGDVYIKGVNALDPQGNVGVLIGGPEGGTIGRVLSAWKKKHFNLVFPVGLEKLIPVPIGQASKEAKRPSYAMGVAVSLLPCPGGKTVTELDAIEILSGAKAIPIAAGGLGGAEGAVTLVIKGNEEDVRRAINHAEQSKGAKVPGLRLFDCHECPFPLCRFPTGDKHWTG